ncbi:MAG: hypothetical protein WCH98_06775 [Verrucomicrobiota bacterium]
MKIFARLFPAVFFVLALAGCYFDHPLTDRPSKDMNTWILGGWESKDDKGRIVLARVAPMNADHYSVRLAVAGKNSQDIKRYEFQAWPSRVGDTLFLTLRCVTSPGDIPLGSHVFAQVQLLDQNEVRVHGLKLDSSPSASSFELRKEVRAKLKDRSLYEGAPSVVWARVEEVAWTADGADPFFKPTRNPMNFAWGPNDDVKDRTRKLFGNSSND